MKLLFCYQCRDMVELQHEMRKCRCGHAFGKYLRNGLNAVYGGSARIIGIANQDIQDALNDGSHSTLRCWMMIDKNAPHIQWVKSIELAEVVENFVDKE